MICPNCGRRNPSGATYCSRCRQRLPLATRYTGQRRTILAEPSGGGGGGALVLGVALLAGFLFIGGGAAIYLSQPQQPLPTDAALVPSAGRTLDVFVQETPTPLPTPVPTPTPIPTIDPFATPTPDPFATPTPDPFATPTTDPFATPTPTAAATPVATEARFSWQQRQGLRIAFSDNSIGQILGWSWDFGDGQSSNDRNPRHDYGAPGEYRVVLTVSGPNGSVTRGRNITVELPSIAVTVTCNKEGDLVVKCTATPGGLSYSWLVTQNTNQLDSATGTETASPTFTFKLPGVGESYRVRFSVDATDGNASGSAISKRLTISGPTPPPTTTPVPTQCVPQEDPCPTEEP